MSTKKTETNHKANEKDAWEYKVSACEEHCYWVVQYDAKVLNHLSKPDFLVIFKSVLSSSSPSFLKVFSDSAIVADHFQRNVFIRYIGDNWTKNKFEIVALGTLLLTFCKNMSFIHISLGESMKKMPVWQA